MKEITIRLDDDVFLKLWAAARRHGLSVEEIARRSIDYALSQLYDPNADPANDPAVRNLLKMLLPVLGDSGEVLQGDRDS